MKNEKEEYLIQLLQNADGTKILSEKLEVILNDRDFYKYGLLTQIIQNLVKNGYGEIVLKNFQLILNTALKDEMLEILEILSTLPEGRQITCNNIDSIFLKLDGEDILEFIDLLDDEKQKEIFKRNEYSYKLYEKGLIRSGTLGAIIKSDLSIFVEEIIKEVSNGKDLKGLESGTYSDVIQTNGYVIKLGETRENFKIPYHPNILQPLLREQITDKNGNNILIVEVQDVVDTKNITQEQRKELIEKLKRAKIRCGDILEGNIGILLKPNKRRLFNGVGGIIDYKDIQEKTLNSGEPVIYDTDLIKKDEFTK